MISRTVDSQQNLQEALEMLEASVSSNEASLIRSALLRFTVPGLGGPKATGDRLKTKEAIDALNFLSSIAIDGKTPEILCIAQKRTFEILKTPKERQRQPRYYLNKFIKLATEQGLFLNPTEEVNEEDYVFYPKDRQYKYVKSTSRERNIKFTLSLNPKDYEDNGLNPRKVNQELNRIKSSLEAFDFYCSDTLESRQITIENDKKIILLVLGWLYCEKKINLEQLGFNCLVPFVNLQPKISDFSKKKNPFMEQMIAKAIAIETLKEESQKLIKILTEFFAWLKNSPSQKTKIFYVGSIISLAKYIYREQTDKAITAKFEDIPIITRLKAFQKELSEKKDHKKPKIIDKCLPWNEVLNVFEKVRFEVDVKTVKQTKYRQKRRMSAIATGLQDCILLGMFVLVPPPRQRVVRELELGRTLKYGLFVDKQFIPAENLSNPDEAKYYIDLQPEDYKTGDIYGEWTGEFPNIQFSDGKFFYDYLNRWFFRGYQDYGENWHGMRSILAHEDVKTVFVGELTGEEIPQSRMSRKIKNIFQRWTGVPVSPQDLRHSFRTHIEDPATGATAEEKESAAFWMRHSSQMAKKTYTHLDCEKKLRKGAILTARINKQFLGSL